MRELLIEDKEGIRIITLNRPSALNALNAKLINEVGEAVEEIRSLVHLHGVIITGAGDKAFAAGADIKGFSTLTHKEAVQLSQEGHNVFNSITNFIKPVVAAIGGYALGGGLELAMACHMRIASHNSVFGMPEVKLGLIPGYGGTQRLAHLIGKAKAMEYILTANMMSAEEALQLGLVNHVVEKGEELSKASELIKTIAKRGPRAISEAIRMINMSTDGSENGFHEEIRSFGNLMVSEECKEGVAAFLEKRPPKFK